MKTIILTVLTVLSINLNAQKTYYKTSRIETYGVDRLTSKTTLKGVFNKPKVVSIDIDNRVVNLTFPNSTKEFSLRLTNHLIDEKSNGTQYIRFDAYDNSNGFYRVYYSYDSITLSFVDDGDSFMIIYYIQPI